MALLHSAFGPDTDIDPLNLRKMRPLNVRKMRPLNVRKMRQLNVREIQQLNVRKNTLNVRKMRLKCSLNAIVKCL